ncbi:hypothetical protein BKA58DRAFT_396560 [Alternaria rosae]|uniref:uncharacterized protein n=1 Tax=Alternaria rosae TaxID=1187941 RepID=UPI001E8EA04B|nr:uncharacterized protein BKA58DRAFT_396560 [Alternaria rosae]KAH6882256.1 hypothetical protein BKA58DRAFT_396560 [Alternaria rosae]
MAPNLMVRQSRETHCPAARRRERSIWKTSRKLLRTGLATGCGVGDCGVLSLLLLLLFMPDFTSFDTEHIAWGDAHRSPHQQYAKPRERHGVIWTHNLVSRLPKATKRSDYSSVIYSRYGLDRGGTASLPEPGTAASSFHGGQHMYAAPGLLFLHSRRR